jgi:hypothetical protein
VNVKLTWKQKHFEKVKTSYRMTIGKRPQFSSYSAPHPLINRIEILNSSNWISYNGKSSYVTAGVQYASWENMKSIQHKS